MKVQEICRQYGISDTTYYKWKSKYGGMVAGDPRLPFGSVKHSAYGRKLNAHGIREFLNIKTVWIKDEAGANLSETE